MDEQVPAGSVRVAIHAPDAVTRIGLAHCIKEDPRLSAIELAKVREATVVVVSVETAEFPLLDILRGMRDPNDQTYPRFLVIVEKRWDIEIFTALNHGVRAVMWRATFNPAAFVRTLLAVANGGASLPPTLQGSLIDHIHWTQREVLAPNGLDASGITAREQDVLRLVAEGRELTEIAEKLSYSERTVKNVLYGLMKRLEFRNRAQAVSYAIRSGLI
jgi:DNA-binding NarL/FixJ family response regulator